MLALQLQASINPTVSFAAMGNIPLPNILKLLAAEFSN